jgi:hypothetical protein
MLSSRDRNSEMTRGCEKFLKGGNDASPFVRKTLL